MGFRPFFLLAGVEAVVCVSMLIAAMCFAAWPSHTQLSPVVWHSHEMLYGFVAAAIAGFLLTAVPNWSETAPLSGWPLALLCLVWLAGRVALLPLGWFDYSYAACIDLVFLPLLMVVLAHPLMRARNRRNLAFLVLLLLLFAGNLLFHNRLGAWFDVSIDGTRLAVDTVLLVVTVVAGRIVPAFTRNALNRLGTRHSIVPTPLLDGVVVASMVGVAVADVIAPNDPISAGAAGVAAVLGGVRLFRWQGWKAHSQPIVWVLHVGYAWLVLGLALKALWLLWALPVAAHWLHALTAGAFGTMIIGVMSRVALGHTGRELVVRPVTVLAYVMVSVGTVLRVFVATFAQRDYVFWVAAGGFVWVAAFVLFATVYGPILVAPRIDLGPRRRAPAV